jgi:phenol hydroxylase P1 protein
LTRHLDEAALLGGAGAYSLLTQHLASWYADNRKWVDALQSSWLADEQHGAANLRVLQDAAAQYLPQVVDAVTTLAHGIDDRVHCDAVTAVDETASQLTDRLAQAGIVQDGAQA